MPRTAAIISFMNTNGAPTGSTLLRDGTTAEARRGRPNPSNTSARAVWELLLEIDDPYENILKSLFRHIRAGSEAILFQGRST